MTQKLNENEWKQVSGDVDPCKHGGIFAKLDGDSIELFGLEPVRGLIGDNEAAEVGFPFWRSEGYYDPSDLQFNAGADLSDTSDRPETAVSVMESVGMESPTKKTWDALEPVYRAVMLFEQGYGKEQDRAGFTQDVLGDAPVLGQDGTSIRIGCFEEEDEFRQEILGLMEVFVCTHASVGCISDSDPFLSFGRGGVVEWTLEQVDAAFEEDTENTEEYQAKWRSRPMAVPTAGFYTAQGESFHVFKAGESSFFSPGYNRAYEAAEALVEAYNEGISIQERIDQDDLDEDAIKHLTATGDDAIPVW